MNKPNDFKKINVWHACLGFLASLVCAIVPTLILTASLSGEPQTIEQKLKDLSFLMLPVQYFSMFVVGVLIILLLRRNHNRANLEFTWPVTTKQLVFSFAGAVAFVAISTIGAWLLPDISEAGKKVASQVGMGENLLRDFTIVLSAVIAAPLGEEIVYRGLIFAGLRNQLQKSNTKIAKSIAFVVPALISSILFAIAHGGEGQSKQVVFLTIFGLIAAWLYHWSGSFYVPVLAHSFTNAINFLILSLSAKAKVNILIYGFIIVAPLITFAIVWATHKYILKGDTISGERAAATTDAEPPPAS